MCYQCHEPYRGWRRQDDVSNGGLELIDVGLVLMNAVVWLNGLDLHVELPGFVFILRVAGRVEGILFGMWAEKLRRIMATTSDQKHGHKSEFHLALFKKNLNNSNVPNKRAWRWDKQKRISFSFTSGLMQKPSSSTWGTFCKNTSRIRFSFLLQFILS